MEEPQNPKHLLDIIDMIGRSDFLLFATDYPHWDFDAPDHALPSFIPDGLRRRIMSSNAYEFYDFNRT
jgi:predicted TIM-barrel fold metal-dependent hydrolase